MNKSLVKSAETKRYLCIDTSQGARVALVDIAGQEFRCLAQVASDDPRRHAEDLALLVDQTVAEAELKSLAKAQIDLIVVGTGPAPFTGLRAGLITARVIAQGLAVPVYGVCSLDVLARQTLDLIAPDRRVLVATDALRKEVYLAEYQASGAHDVQLLYGPQVGTPACFAQRAAAPGLVLAGSGSQKYPEQLPSDGDFPSRIDLVAMARLAHARLDQVDLDSFDFAETTAPLYLRRPDVQEPKTK